MAWFVENWGTIAKGIRTTKIVAFAINIQETIDGEEKANITFWLENGLERYETSLFNYQGDLKPLIASIIEMCHDPSPTVYTIQGLLKLAEKHKKQLKN